MTDKDDTATREGGQRHTPKGLSGEMNMKRFFCNHQHQIEMFAMEQEKRKPATLRERIADWISGGALAREKYYKHRMEWFAREMDEAHERLDRIAALETPSATDAERRMARIARGEA
jgi:hypothetical protein